MRAFAGKTVLGFECVPATVEHSLLRLPWAGEVPDARLVVDTGAEQELVAPLPGGGPVLAFPVANRMLTRPEAAFRLLVGATLHELPAPVRRHPVSEAAAAQSEIAALGAEVDRLSSRLASRERRRAGGRASGRRPGVVSAIGVSLLAAGLMAAVLPALGTEGGRPAAAVGHSLAPLPPVATPAHADIPGDYVARYQEAGRRHRLDWHVLAAVGKLETGHGRWLDNASGAAGPAQFLSATWQRYGFDGDTDGRIDVYDPDDAIPAMASYLRASGAPDNWRAALLAYNRSPRYVDEVLRLAEHYRSWRGR